jgi:hypothetical protein
MGYSNQMPNPTNFGTKHNLPEHVRAVAGLRNKVIACKTLDPEHEGDMMECYYAGHRIKENVLGLSFVSSEIHTVLVHTYRYIREMITSSSDAASHNRLKCQS